VTLGFGALDAEQLLGTAFGHRPVEAQNALDPVELIGVLGAQIRIVIGIDGPPRAPRRVVERPAQHGRARQGHRVLERRAHARAAPQPLGHGLLQQGIGPGIGQAERIAH
jgi:hypothetical protein